MKITEIECIPISVPLKSQPGRLNNTLLIKISTDEGITGIGDGGLDSQDIVTMMVNLEAVGSLFNYPPSPNRHIRSQSAVYAWLPPGLWQGRYS